MVLWLYHGAQSLVMGDEPCRNVMSEFMGLVRGMYDAKQSGFLPGALLLELPSAPLRSYWPWLSVDGKSVKGVFEGQGLPGA